MVRPVGAVSGAVPVLMQKVLVSYHMTHRRSGPFTQRGRGGFAKARQIRAIDGQHEARLGAQLSGAHCHRVDIAPGDRFATRGQRAGQHEQGVDAAHLGIDRNRHRSRGGAHQCQAPCARAGKANGLNRRMPHQRHADLIAGVVD
jgi:hypothetical protein